METSKAYERRLAAGWFDKYITGKVIDIGCGRFGSMGIDPITPDCEMHDIDMCDAHTMEIYKDESFDTVYSSHVLEHMEDPAKAVMNWWRILKTGGHLIISVPDMFAYERQLHLPSRWNPDHKSMWTYNVVLPYDWVHDIHEVYAWTKQSRIVLINPAITCTNLSDLNKHGDGEYSIEIILKKYE
jgi:predicted SAM-dependent methyltransferase